MELAIFAAEFVSDPYNYIPVLAVGISGGVLLVFASTRWAISSPLSMSLAADAVAGTVLMAAASFFWSEDLSLIVAEPLFWVGLGLTLAIAWPALWVLALLLGRAQQSRLHAARGDVFE